MGRQHTTWISDETWERLKDIPGGSTSERLRNAVKFADPNEQMVTNAKMRQLDTAQNALKRINAIADVSTAELADHAIMKIKEILEEIWWMVEA